MDIILSGKIDGPTSTLAIFNCQFSKASDQYEIDNTPIGKKNFETKEYEHNIPKMIDDFFLEYPNEKENVVSACFGIAGEVKTVKIQENEQCKQSQIKRVPIHLETHYFSERDFSERLLYNLPVSFINDMEAIGYSIFLGDKEPLEVLNEGKQSDPNKLRALMLVGSGLGQNLWRWNKQEKEFTPDPSEGGHDDFSLSSLEDMKLWQYCYKDDPISWEFFLSNSGLVKIYQFLKQQDEQEPEPEQVKIALEKNSTDPSPIITEVSTNSQPNTLCRKAIEMFISLWGAKAGNIALDYLSDGGLYIGGNPLLTDLLKKDKSLQEIFLEKFTTKGEEAGLRNSVIPVKIYREEDIVLRGAARFAARFIPDNKLFISSR